MKKLFFLSVLTFLTLTACKNDDDNPSPDGPGTIEIEFDNLAIVNGIQRQLNLKEIGSTDYNYQNSMGQDFNITFLRYFVSNIVLEGPNGERFEDPQLVDVASSSGYYLIDEATPASQLVKLEDVPAGEYNKITFMVGVSEEGVKEGAAGGALDPATNGMFWNWNAGYVAVKLEGQSSVSAGGAIGNTIEPENEKGLVFHVGGWKDIEGTAFINNNQTLTYAFDVNAKIGADEAPHIHMIMDVLQLFTGKNQIDFTGNNNVHKPTDGKAIAENLSAAFAFDHLHQ